MVPQVGALAQSLRIEARVLLGNLLQPFELVGPFQGPGGVLGEFPASSSTTASCSSPTIEAA